MVQWLAWRAPAAVPTAHRSSKQAHDMSSQLEQQARKQSNCTTLYSPRDWSAEYYFL